MNHNWPLLLIGPMVLFSSCIDDGYDLANIDDSVQVKVNELVVPLNLDALKLDKLIDPEEGDQIIKTVDPATGKTIYALVGDGEFNVSSDISIDFQPLSTNIETLANQLDLRPLKDDLDDILQNAIDEQIAQYMQQYYGDLQPGDPEYDNAYRDAVKYSENHRDEAREAAWVIASEKYKDEELADYIIYPSDISIEIYSNSIDKVVRSLSRVGTDSDIQLAFSVSKAEGQKVNLAKVLHSVSLYDLRIQFPKGLIATPYYKGEAAASLYNTQTGILDLSDASLTAALGRAEHCTLTDGKFEDLFVRIHGFEVADINASQQERDKVSMLFTPGDDKQPGSVNLTGKLAIISEEQHEPHIKIFVDDFTDGYTFWDLPNVTQYQCTSEMEDIVPLNITGTIDYTAEDTEVAPFSISNLPDIIANDQTNVLLGNPQLYLKFYNPLDNADVNIETTLTLQGEKGGVLRNPESVDIGIKTDREVSLLCLAPQPEKVTAMYTGYEGADLYRFAGLKDIVSGAGLPDSVNIDIKAPHLFGQVNDYDLVNPVTEIRGAYTFFAPLALAEGSLIVFEKEWNGWNDDTVDKLVITNLKLTANITKDIPLGATLSIIPIDKSGAEIANVSFSKFDLKANLSNQDVEFRLEKGEIKHLDGIKFYATIVGDDAETIMSPIQQLEFQNLKITVSGSYEEVK